MSILPPNAYVVLMTRYHIIAPSLPGYGFSDQAPLETDLDVYQVAYLFDSLMNGLGFDKYVAQGGDIGSYITWRLAKEHDSCVGELSPSLNARELTDSRSCQLQAIGSDCQAA